LTALQAKVNTGFDFKIKPVQLISRGVTWQFQSLTQKNKIKNQNINHGYTDNQYFININPSICGNFLICGYTLISAYLLSISGFIPTFLHSCLLTTLKWHKCPDTFKNRVRGFTLIRS